MKRKGHGTARAFAWVRDGKVMNYRAPHLARLNVGDVDGYIEKAVRVITESEFQRLIKRAIANDTYDLFQRKRKP